MAHGLESPFDDKWFYRPSPRTTGSPPPSTSTASTACAPAPLRAHATQVDPTSPFWFGLPDDVAATIHPYEDYVRARSIVDAPLPETDLFAGLADLAAPERRAPAAGRTCR